MDQVLYYEKQLLDTSNRKNIDILDKLIHPDFKEIVEDGSLWTRDKIINFLINDNSNTSYSMMDYSFCVVSDHIVIISYGLTKRLADSIDSSRRSSLWILENDWQILFHQVLT